MTLYERSSPHISDDVFVMGLISKGQCMCSGEIELGIGKEMKGT